MQEVDGKKELIISTARTLFARLGYAGVGIRKIAEESNCNLSAISYYFGGKEKLYAECFNLDSPQDNIDFSDLLSTPQSLKDFAIKLRSFCIAFAHYAIRHTEIMQLLVSEMNAQVLGPPNLHKSIFKPIREPLFRFFEEGKKLGIINPNINVPIVARMILAGLVIEVIFLKESNSIDLIVDELINICNGSIYV